MAAQCCAVTDSNLCILSKLLYANTKPDVAWSISCIQACSVVGGIDPRPRERLTGCRTEHERVCTAYTADCLVMCCVGVCSLVPAVERSSESPGLSLIGVVWVRTAKACPPRFLRNRPLYYRCAPSHGGWAASGSFIF